MTKPSKLIEAELAQVWGGGKFLAPRTIPLGGGNAITVGPLSTRFQLSGPTTNVVAGGMGTAAAFVPGPAGKAIGAVGAWIGAMNTQGEGVTITNYGAPVFGRTVVRPR